MDEAMAANERALAIAGDKASNAWRAHIVRLQALTGRADQARAGLTRLPVEVTSRRQRIGTAQLAYAYEALGDRARALDLLEQALSEREPDLLWLAVDPRADFLRSDSRFQQVLARLGIPQ